MRILLTGADGYIGSLLGPLLLERGHDVVGLDTGYYRAGWLCNDGLRRTPPCITQDIRCVVVEDLSGFDALVHLAELSNDRLGQLNPKITFQVNHWGSVRLAALAKGAGVERFVYTSSCSVYGAGFDDVKTEQSEVNPLTAHAKCKVLVERDVSALADDRFTPTFLRNASAYGPSPRMRFDLVVNNLSGHAFTAGVIKMTSDGTPWRPLVHVLDICEAIACTLEAPREAVHNEVLNVGDNEGNYRVREVAEIVSETFPGCELTIGSSEGDDCSYRVSFDKIREKLPGFRCRGDVAMGAKQLLALFERIELTREAFECPAYTRLKQLQYLLRTRQIDADLFWRTS